MNFNFDNVDKVLVKAVQDELIATTCPDVGMPMLGFPLPAAMIGVLVSLADGGLFSEADDIPAVVGSHIINSVLLHTAVYVVAACNSDKERVDEYIELVRAMSEIDWRNATLEEMVKDIRSNRRRTTN